MPYPSWWPTSSSSSSLTPPGTPLHVSEDLIEPPAIEPLDVDQTKKDLRFTPSSEDTLIDEKISAAREMFEMYTGRQLITAVWELRLEAFPIGDVIELPHPPLQEIVSVTYTDSDGADATLSADDYIVTAAGGPHARPGRIRPVSIGSWPTITRGIDAIRIRYRAGYGDHPGAVPGLVKQALYMLVGHFHQHRGAVQDQRHGNLIVVPIGATDIMKEFKYSARMNIELRGATV